MNKTTPESRKLERQVLKWHNEKFDKLTGLKVVKGKLKMFTPEAKETIKLKPEITYKMKKVINSIKKAVLHLNILSLLFLFACGSDNPVNNGSNPPVSGDTFKLDSFSLFTANTLSTDTTYNNNSINLTLDSFSIAFDALTNVTHNSDTYITVNLIDSGSVIANQIVNFENLNNRYLLKGKGLTNGLKLLTIRLHIENLEPFGSWYLSVKNLFIVKY